MPAENSRPNVSGQAILLGTRIEIYPGTPLPEYNSAGGPAFAARVKGDAGSDLVAIICNTGMPARLDLVNGMKSTDNPVLMRLYDAGVVVWADGIRYSAFAYQRPAAPLLMRSMDEAHAPLSEDVIHRRLIQPMAHGLLDLLRMGVAHGAIRPTNIFWRLGSATAPVLGDCMSAPAGINQPAMFETIERGMTMPLGRGPGTHGDDCYAFGVTLGLFILGHNPFKGMDDRAVVRAKMEQGTFNALIGHHRLSAPQVEILRGLLSDDSHQRWTAADIEQWLGGRRLTPKSSDAGRRSSRHIEFAGKEYWQLRPLAKAFSEHVQEAALIIENGSFDKWLRRSFGDDDVADEVSDAVASAKEAGKGSNYEEQVVARVCMALDPSGPIRYRGLAVMPGGIAGMLAHTLSTGGNPGVLADIISTMLVSFWVEMHKQYKTDLVPLAQQFERLTSVIEKSAFGSGVERALYELNSTLHCLSPMLRAQMVTSPRALLPALERIAASSARPPEPMDRHIAAYLVVRDRRSEGVLEAMGAPENSPRRAMAMLSLFSELQNRHGPENLPHLAKWLSPLLEPAIRRYFGKSVKESLQKQVKDAIDRGDIGALAKIVDNPQRLGRDEEEFVAARLLYLNILKEINA
ncbi:MAG: serine/threonine protein kinase, partial [Bdellovibrionales bacterium]